MGRHKQKRPTKRLQRKRHRGFRSSQVVYSLLGRAREELVFALLQGAVRQGLIRSADLTTSCGLEDAQGTDLFFYGMDRSLYRLQVKSNTIAAVEFKEIHPTIPVVIVKSCDDPASVLAQLKALFPFLRKLELPKCLLTRVGDADGGRNSKGAR